MAQPLDRVMVGKSLLTEEVVNALDTARAEDEGAGGAGHGATDMVLG